jgi:hypothetical protein
MQPDFLNTIAVATGLPQEMVMRELMQLIEKAGKSAETIGLDDLREILAQFLQDVLLETKSNLDQF